MAIESLAVAPLPVIDDLQFSPPDHGVLLDSIHFLVLMDLRLS
jgi:hypothetical protein